MNSTCDHCQEEYEVNIKTDSLPNGVEKNSFACPHCDTEYIAFCTNPSVRQKQADIKVLYYKLRNTRNENKRIKVIDDIESSEDSIKKDMKAIKDNLAIH